MEVVSELLAEVEEVRNGKDSSYLDKLIDKICNGYELTEIGKEFHCSISMSAEKHNQLQYTEYYSISSKLINAELYL